MPTFRIECLSNFDNILANFSTKLNAIMSVLPWQFCLWTLTQWHHQNSPHCWHHCYGLWKYPYTSQSVGPNFVLNYPCYYWPAGHSSPQICKYPHGDHCRPLQVATITGRCIWYSYRGWHQSLVLHTALGIYQVESKAWGFGLEK